MKKHKIIIYISIFILFIISVINLYNAKYLNSFYDNYYIKQIIWYVISIIIFIFINKYKINYYKYSKYLYFFNVLLLVYVLLFAKPINGTKAWINLGFFSFEPSEIMKLSLALFLIIISQKKEKQIINIFKLFIYTIIPSILVFLEPDTGAIIFYFVILFSVLISKKINYKYYIFILTIGLIFITSFIYLYINNQDILIKLLGTSFFYRVERIINFKVNNYQLDLALISIFSSSIIRNGFNNILIYIPEGATDFILAFSIGSFGYIILLLIIIAYILIIISLLNLIKNNKNKKTNYLVISFILMFFVQSIINISMNIGLIPIIGITLPFISYGGSSLLLYFIYLGIIFLSINMDYL